MSHQRNLANLRERKRMMLINKGFDLLRSRLPIKALIEEHNAIKLSSSKSKRYRLTKVDILKLTINYIKQLDRMLQLDPLEANNSILMNCIETLNDDERLKESRVKNHLQKRRSKRRQSSNRRDRHHHQRAKSENGNELKLNTSNKEMVVHYTDQDCRLPQKYIIACGGDQPDNGHDGATISNTKLWVPEFN